MTRPDTLTRLATLPLACLITGLLSGCHNGAGPEDPEAKPVAPDSPGVEAEDIEGRPVVRAEELLRGRFPGVRVIDLPGGGFAVRVWGPGTFQGGKDPLYVVDGMPIHFDPVRGLDWLNPSDIERIDVLKDVSETAAYGARGGNGVVVIITKRGSGGG